MKNYQKPEVEIIKFSTMESVMSEQPPEVGGGTGTGSSMEYEEG